jgi:hypothetical protein
VSSPREGASLVKKMSLRNLLIWLLVVSVNGNFLCKISTRQVASHQSLSVKNEAASNDRLVTFGYHNIASFYIIQIASLHNKHFFIRI